MEEKEEVEYHVASLEKLDDATLDEITDKVLASERGGSAMRSLMRSVMKSAFRSTMKSAEHTTE